YVTDETWITIEEALLKVKNVEQLLRSEKASDSVDIFLCRYCSQKFGQKFKRTVHEKTCSRNGRIKKDMLQSQFYCDQCGSQFKQERSLKRHMLHDCGKTHQCKKCGKIFGTLRTLNLHVRKCRTAKDKNG
ncbi:zinc finger protein 569-like, partial [Leptopilina heterotoma]|uniref:zinc finger protein 569-like n=1 Tax=Leptopilina heterotoma TaxID=63436 RepID=UPI001CA95F68